MSFLGGYNSTGGIQLSFLGVYNSTGGIQISFLEVYNSTGGIQLSVLGLYNSTGGIQISFLGVYNFEIYKPNNVKNLSKSEKNPLNFLPPPSSRYSRDALFRLNPLLSLNLKDTWILNCPGRMKENQGWDYLYRINLK